LGRLASSSRLGVAEPGDVCRGFGLLAELLVFQGDPLDDGGGEFELAA
jgi:hypothetical protein